MRGQMMMKRVAAIVLAVMLWLMSALPASAASGWQSYVYDDWGESIPAPLAYSADAVYSGQSLGLAAMDSPEDIFVSADGQVYITDRGQRVILQLDGQMKLVREIRGYTDENGEQREFTEPCGVFADGTGDIYVADYGAGQVVRLDRDLRLVRVFGRPETDLMDENTEYHPLRVVADTIGHVYVVAYGLYQGLVKYSADGRFMGFFGGNKVEVTPELILRQFWRRLFTEEQLDTSSRSVPIEYSNAAIDENNFIYAVVLQTATSLDEVKKINAQGKNVLHYSDVGAHYERNDFGDIEKDYTATTTYVDNRMVDIAVGQDGTMAVLDGERGHIFVYDQDMNLLFTFGEKGDQRGQFRQPVSIARLGDTYLVADALKKCVIAFAPTAYAAEMTEAMSYYSDGKYVESVEHWQKVLRRNAGCRIAYKSIGKAYLQQGGYRQAMECFRNADDKEGYSTAYGEYRKLVLREHPLIVCLCIVGIAAVLIVITRLVRRFFGKETRRRRTVFR